MTNIPLGRRNGKSWTRRPYLAGAARVSLPYLAIGWLWILVSDLVPLITTTQPIKAAAYSVSKGMAFVAFTAFILHLLVQRLLSESAGANEGLERLRRRYHLLVANLNNPLFIFEAPRLPGPIHLSEVSDAAGALLGYGRGELEGISLSALVGEGHAQSFLDELAREGIHSARVLLLARDGSEVPVDLRMRSLPWEGGHLILACAHGAHRVSGADSLDERERETLRAALRAAEDGFISMDTEGAVLAMNPAAERMIGVGLVRRGDPLKVWELLHPGPGETADPLRGELESIREHGRGLMLLNLPVGLPGEEGASLLLTGRVVPVRDREGGVIGAVLVFKARRKG